jgi:hypothetical protein
MAFFIGVGFPARLGLYPEFPENQIFRPIRSQDKGTHERDQEA